MNEQLVPNTLYRQGSTGPYIEFIPPYLPATEVKSVGGRWLKKTNSWKLPPALNSLYALIRLFPDEEVVLDEFLRWKISSRYGFKTRSTDWVVDRTDREIVKRLYPFQLAAVKFLVSSPFSGSLLGLSPGLGKTATSIISANALRAERVLVVSPLSLLGNWAREISQWSNPEATLPITICHKRGPAPLGWSVANYNTVTGLFDEFAGRQRWDALIIDESILVKNRKAQRTEMMARLRARARKTWLLSGSPISKHADDLYAQLALVFPKGFTSYWRFVDMYCLSEPSRWGTKIIGTRRNINLRDELRDLAFIRHQRNVLPHLPDILFEAITVSMEPEQARIYDEMEKTFIAELGEGVEMTAASKAAQLTRLLQCVSSPRNFGEEWPEESGKLSTLLELFEVRGIECPALIWVHWRETGELLKRVIEAKVTKKVGLVIGGTEGADQIIQDYKSGKLDILILSLGVGKYGHTLINTRTAVYYDKSFDADAYVQSLSRIHGRIGASHKPVAISLVTSGTADELVLANLQTKSRSIAHLSDADLKLLLGGLREARTRS